MDIKINDELVSVEINKATDKAIMDALRSYSVQSAIEKEIANRLIIDVMGRALSEAVEKIDINLIAQKIAEEISRQAISSVSHVMQEAMIGIVMKVQGRSDYGENGEKERAQIRAILEQRKQQG